MMNGDQKNFCLVQIHEIEYYGYIASYVAVQKAFIDHDHATGIVRGFLCHHCNSGIGFLRDNCYFICNAMRYLLFHGDYNINMPLV